MSHSKLSGSIMYLDADGVLFPYRLVEIPSLYGGKPELYNKSIEYCDPDISRALASLAVEIVIASSRQQTFMRQFDYLAQQLGAKRAVDIDPVESADIRLKRDAVLRDYEQHNKPFIWVDDHIPALGEDAKKEIEERYNSLLIAPEGMVGLTLNEIETINKFISRQET